MTTFPRGPAPTRDSRHGVLAVDREPRFRRILRDGLRPHYRFWSSGDVEGAGRILQRARGIRGVLLDVGHPGTGELEFGRRLHSEMPHLKLFLTTGCDPAALAPEGFRIGAAGFLPKPFTIETLRLMLASHLGSTEIG